MPNMNNAKILIMATNGFEQSELQVPLKELRDAGATVHVATLDGKAIKGWDQSDWGESVDGDLKISDVNVDDYIALVLPGGQINPDILRADETAVPFDPHRPEERRGQCGGQRGGDFQRHHHLAQPRRSARVRGQDHRRGERRRTQPRRCGLSALLAFKV